MSMTPGEALLVLGLPSECSREEITHSFRFLSICFHPDRFPEKWKPLAHEKMIAIIAAREALKNYTHQEPTQNRAQNSEEEETALAGKNWKPTFSPGIQLCNGSRCRELFIQEDEPAILVDERIYFHPWCYQ